MFDVAARDTTSLFTRLLASASAAELTDEAAACIELLHGDIEDLSDVLDKSLNEYAELAQRFAALQQLFVMYTAVKEEDVEDATEAFIAMCGGSVV